ncbi:glycosyltransferase family 4 protein [Salinicoccus sp. YB14-2]|uniref:glycosyltransferase family 4 protein n=1 Tax=Salinicoccus sp. YB14-2 TaxID=1572701 RepID=UPI0006897D79|nr:glycosyltransferase family 4 protein [Salinicoccus sp. YB14-2]
MKILLITQNFYPEIGSGANRLKNLYKHLSKDNDVDVLTTAPTYPNKKLYQEKKYWDEPEIDRSPEILRLKMRIDKQSKSLKMRVLYYLELAYKVWLYVKRYQADYDVVYVTSPNIFLPWATFFSQKKHAGVKRVLEVRDLWPDSVKEIEKLKINWFFPVLKRMEKQIYKLADKIIVNNEEFKDHILKITPKKKILYLPNSLQRSEIDFKEANGSFKVIYTGNIGLAQNYEQIKEVADDLEKSKIKFNIIGYGAYAHELRDIIEEQDMKYVTFYDEKSREECLDLTRDHNVALSLLKESEVFLRVLPGKVVDAIGSGVPVVSNLSGYSADLINHSNVGFSKPKATTAHIIKMIKEIKDNPDLEKEMRSNARQLTEDLFIWENNIVTLNGFLKD